MNCSQSGFPALHHLLSLLKLISIDSVMPFNHLILCHPLLLLPSVFPSIRVLSNSELFPDNHHGVVTHLEPDILECEVKRALGSITRNKASRGDGIPVELFQILKDDAVKVLHSVCQQIWETQQWPQDWKRSLFIPIPKKGNGNRFQYSCLENPMDRGAW